MLEEFSHALEALRAGVPLAYLVVPVLMIVVSPVAVNAAHEFTAYRMQQYDLQGSSYGCRSSIVNSEARTLESSSYEHKCVLIKSDDLTRARYLNVLDSGPTAVIIIINGNMSQEQAQNFMELEEELLRSEPSIPVYFAYDDRDLTEIYEKVSLATKKNIGSAFQALVDSATFVGYHLMTLGPQTKPIVEHSIANIQGVLPGLGDPDQLPTIAIVAHYDSFGVAPDLAYGANSGASGVVMLLELARILGKLYSNPRTHPKHNTLFLLAGGGKFNYQGSRKWIEDALDNAAYSTNVHQSTSLLPSARLVVCLDTLAGGEEGDSLHMHVSKPPSRGSLAHQLHTNIEMAAGEMYRQLDTSIVHKKIRLSSDALAWEHERYSIRRLHAVTLSSLASYDVPIRRSIMDTKDRISTEVLTRNIDVISRAVVTSLYNVDGNSSSLVNGDFAVQKDRVVSWLNFLASQSRATQITTEDHLLVTSLESELVQHLSNTNVHVSFVKPDRRDPEFVFYDGSSYRMTASIVRSAVFDLYLTLTIACYVTVLYLLVMKFSCVLSVARRVGAIQKVKVA